jgi:hypothetical protein
MHENLTNQIASRILSSLRDGVPSVEDIHFFSSSSNPLDPKIEFYLKEISDGNYGKIIFLNGSYGEGKSHFLSRVRKNVLDQGFLVSMFQISPRGVSLDMMERAFSEIMKNLKSKNFLPEEAETIIEFILSNWIAKNSEFVNLIRRMKIDKDFKAALSEIGKRLDHRDDYYEDLDVLDRWLKAEKPKISDLKSKFKIFNHINPRNVFDILKSLGIFAKKIGYKGLVILIDEQEIISTLLTTRKRELTEQNIRILIDEQGKMDGIFILFATTDEFFNDPVKGVVSYPALKTRITKSNTLELPPIDKKEMTEIAYNIRGICNVAWNMKIRLNDDQIAECVKIAKENNIPSARARTYVKSVVSLMEQIRDGDTKNPTEQFSEIYNSTFIEVATERENFEAEN